MLKLNIDEIISLYESGKSLSFIANNYNCDTSTIVNRLKKYYPNENYKNYGLDKEELLVLYIDGLTYQEIADRYNKSLICIERIIKKYLRQIDKVERKNIIEKHEINKKNYYIPLKLKNNIKEIVILYENNISLKRLSKIYNCTEKTLKKGICNYYKNKNKGLLVADLTKNNTPKLSEKRYNDAKTIPKKESVISKSRVNKYKNQCNLYIDEIINLFKRGYSRSYIAKILNVSIGTINNKIYSYYNEKPKILSIEELERRLYHNDNLNNLYEQKKQNEIITFKNIFAVLGKKNMYYLNKNNINRYNIKDNIIEENKKIKDKTLIKIPKSFK